MKSTEKEHREQQGGHDHNSKMRLRHGEGFCHPVILQLECVDLEPVVKLALGAAPSRLNFGKAALNARCLWT
jgi:hypothetical protein